MALQKLIESLQVLVVKYNFLPTDVLREAVVLTPARSEVACSASAPAEGKPRSNHPFQVDYWKPG